MFNVIIIGGGAAGLFCGCFSPQNTLILDQHKIGRKLEIAGNGRVNLTNTLSVSEFVEVYNPNGDFLRDAFKVFFRDDLLNFIHSLGLKTRIEENKVFLANNKGKDLVLAFKNFILKRGVVIHEGEKVIKITKKESNFIVHTLKNTYSAGSVVIATGGLSYPKLGSSGDGYKFAQIFGHTITPIKPYETPLCIKNPIFQNLSGITLDSVTIKHKNEIYSGSLLITHFGLSGPVILDVSSKASNKDIILINFLGFLRDDFLNDLKSANNFRSLLKKYLPNRFLNRILLVSGLYNKTIAEASKRELNVLLDILFNFKIIVHLCGFNRSFVTLGGISLKEVDPKTCASKLVDNLYFCGEVLDIAGPIGGFNLQAAFSTGYLVAQKLGNLPLKNI